jgi:hypothetical protein
LIDGHLLNLRRVKDAQGNEDWADKIENHLGLAKVYARLAATQSGKPIVTGAFTAETIKMVRTGGNLLRGGIARPSFLPRRIG